MAGENTEVAAVVAPPQTLEEFSTLYSGLKNPETAPVVVQEGKPAAESPVDFFGRLKAEFPEFAEANEDLVIAKYREYVGLAPRVADFEKKIQDLEAKNIDYPTPSARDWALYQRQLIAEGITDPKQLEERAWSHFQEARVDYTAMAKSEPAKVIEIGLRRQYPNATGEQIGLLMEDAGVLKAPDVADFNGDAEDPEFIRESEAYRKSTLRLQLKAELEAQKLEAAKPKVDFTPQGVKSEADTKAEEAAFQQKFHSAHESFVAGFKGVEFGNGDDVVTHPMKVEGKLESLLNIVKDNPAALIEALCLDKEGNIDPDKMYNLTAKHYFLDHGGLAEVVNARVEAAKAGTYKDVTNTLANSGAPAPGGGQGAGNGEKPLNTLEDWKRQYPRA